MTSTRSGRQPAAPSAASRWKQRVLLGVSILALAGAAAYGLVWWQERSLHEAARLLEAGQIEAAVALVGEFLSRHPDNTRAVALMARARVKQGQPQQALDLFREIGAASPADLHALAQAHLMLDHWSEGVALLEQVLAQDPDNTDALYEVTSCRLRLGRYDEALESARRFAAQPDSAARGHLFIGTIHGERQNYSEAVAAFAEVLRHEPDAANLQVRADEFFLQYGEFLVRAGRPAAAIEPLTRSATLLPTAESLVSLGNAYAQIKQFEQAEEAWQQAIAKDPVSLEAREALAGRALQQQRAQDALQWLKPLENNARMRSSTAYLFQQVHAVLRDESAVTAWQQRTEALRKREEFDSTLQSILVEDPQSFWARAIRAHQFASRGNWNEAESLVGSLLAEAPSDPFVNQLAEAVGRRGGLPPLENIPLQQF